MAHDDRPERGRRGGQAPRAHRLGDRDWRGQTDDPDYGAERYGPGAPEMFGDEFGPTGDPGSFFTAPGYDAEFGGPRFDRADVGSVGSHGVHPVSSAFGGDYRGGFNAGPGGFGASSARRYALLRQRGEAGRHDPHYAEWRRRQIDRLDRDYDEYRREHQARFDREFGEWRERRGRQRQALGRVCEHMEVVGSDGSHVGTVDGTSGDSIILTRSDPNAGGVHHRIPCAWVEGVDETGAASSPGRRDGGPGLVKLNLSAAEAMARWREEEGNRALFERGGAAGRREGSFSPGDRGGGDEG